MPALRGGLRIRGMTIPADRVPRRAAPVVKRRHVVGAGPVVVLGVLVAGSYFANWRWTGFTANGTLWDWLHLLLLPFAVATLPLWFRAFHGRRRWWVWSVVGIAVAFAVVVVGGYVFDWTWTGFRGNTLWDWLELLLFPVVLPVSLFWLAHREELVERRLEEEER